MVVALTGVRGNQSMEAPHGLHSRIAAPRQSRAFAHHVIGMIIVPRRESLSANEVAG